MSQEKDAREKDEDVDHLNQRIVKADLMGQAAPVSGFDNIQDSIHLAQVYRSHTSQDYLSNNSNQKGSRPPLAPSQTSMSTHQHQNYSTLNRQPSCGTSNLCNTPEQQLTNMTAYYRKCPDNKCVHGMPNHICEADCIVPRQQALATVAAKTYMSPSHRSKPVGQISKPLHLENKGQHGASSGASNMLAGGNIGILSTKSTATIQGAAAFGACGFNSARIENIARTKDNHHTLNKLYNKQDQAHADASKAQNHPELNLSSYKTARTDSQQIQSKHHQDTDFINSASASESIQSSHKRQNINVSTPYELKKQNYFNKKDKISLNQQRMFEKLSNKGAIKRISDSRSKVLHN